MVVRALMVATLAAIPITLFAGCDLPLHGDVCSPAEFGCNVGAACTTTNGYPECGMESGYTCECSAPIDFECPAERGTLIDGCVVIG